VTAGHRADTVPTEVSYNPASGAEPAPGRSLAARGGATSIPTADFDGAWKEALEAYLPDALALLAPTVHAAIDWSRGLDFLDKELQQVAVLAAVGPRAVDKLVRVWRRDGDEAWVLVHVEAQHQRDDAFARRMFTYYTRLLDRFDRPVVSLAILGDAEPGWRPDGWRLELLGCGIDFRFLVVKLLDFRNRLGELTADRNPFAAIVLAHLEALTTRQDAPGRRRAKFALVRRLYELDYSREEAVRLYRLIDWLLRLPEALETAFWQEVRAYEEERHMTYITSAERIGIEKGLAQGLREGLEEALLLKFGEEGRLVADELTQVDDVEVLRAVKTRLRTATSPADVRAVYRPPTGAV
jgi:hypothetical protein